MNVKCCVKVIACGGAAQQQTFSYVCVEPHRAGTLSVEKCDALGLPPGRNRQLLKDGFEVENALGEVIKPDEVRALRRLTDER